MPQAQRPNCGEQTTILLAAHRTPVTVLLGCDLPDGHRSTEHYDRPRRALWTAHDDGGVTVHLPPPAAAAATATT